MVCVTGGPSDFLRSIGFIESYPVRSSPHSLLLRLPELVNEVLDLFCAVGILFYVRKGRRVNIEDHVLRLLERVLRPVHGARYTQLANLFPLKFATGQGMEHILS